MIHGISPFFQARIHHAQAKDQNLSPKGPAWKHQGRREVPHRGGILYPDDTDEKTRKSIQSVLKSKHPDVRTPSTDTLTAYHSKQELNPPRNQST
jgi:hypothetical protein